jgi:hypothetical protein
MPRLVNRSVALAVGLTAHLAMAEHAVTAGGFTGTTLASFGSSPGVTGFYAAWTYRTGSLVTGLGVRVSAPSVANPIPLEAFSRTGLTVDVGPWAPLLAVELGVSGLSGLNRPLALRPQDFTLVENRLTGVFYVAMHTEALRFTYRRFTFSMAGVDVGTSLTAAGTVFRVNLELVSVGVRW